MHGFSGILISLQNVVKINFMQELFYTNKF